MRAAVIYRSKTGFTKKYAQWLAEELAADLFSATKVSGKMLSDYDTIIFGGSLYAVGILGVKLITKNMDQLKGKKLVVFATGASPVRPEIIAEVESKNFTAQQREQIRFFYLRGGFNFGKLGLLDKMLMLLLKWSLKRKKELTPDEKGMLAIYDHPVDYTKKKYIEEIIAYVNS